jgi:hypothetical protein
VSNPVSRTSDQLRKKIGINWKGLKQKQATKTGKNNQAKKHTLENDLKSNKTKPENQKSD